MISGLNYRKNGVVFRWADCVFFTALDWARLTWGKRYTWKTPWEKCSFVWRWDGGPKRALSERNMYDFTRLTIRPPNKSTCLTETRSHPAAFTETKTSNFCSKCHWNSKNNRHNVPIQYFYEDDFRLKFIWMYKEEWISLIT